jgi:hypothetical protein
MRSLASVEQENQNLFTAAALVLLQQTRTVVQILLPSAYLRRSPVRHLPNTDAYPAFAVTARDRRDSRTVNSVKSPTSLSTVMVPPCCCVTIS